MYRFSPKCKQQRLEDLRNNKRFSDTIHIINHIYDIDKISWNSRVFWIFFFYLKNVPEWRIQNNVINHFIIFSSAKTCFNLMTRAHAMEKKYAVFGARELTIDYKTIRWNVNGFSSKKRERRRSNFNTTNEIWLVAANLKAFPEFVTRNSHSKLKIFYLNIDMSWLKAIQY